MSDSKISALPSVAATTDADILPLVQTNGAALVTRRASLAQLRSGILADRPLHVREFGAVGNGNTNDAPAIQAAINALKAAGGGVLQFGARVYRIASPVVIDGVTVILQGAGFTEGPNEANGTWFKIDQTGFTPFTFSGTMACVSITAAPTALPGRRQITITSSAFRIAWVLWISITSFWSLSIAVFGAIIPAA
jgi:hypothetical protein